MLSRFGQAVLFSEQDLDFRMSSASFDCLPSPTE